MDDLELRNYYQPVSATRDTRKRLARVEQEAMVKRAAMDAAARDAMREEQVAAARAALRIQGTYNLAEYASLRATQLDASISLQSRGNPRLEQIHRGFEEAAAVTAQQVIFRYGMGR